MKCSLLIMFMENFILTKFKEIGNKLLNNNF